MGDRPDRLQLIQSCRSYRLLLGSSQTSHLAWADNLRICSDVDVLPTRTTFTLTMTTGITFIIAGIRVSGWRLPSYGS